MECSPPMSSASTAVSGGLGSNRSADAGGAGRATREAALSLPFLLALGLFLLTLVAYRGALDDGFVNYDDPDYVTESPAVRAGLTREGLRWAATAVVAANWHPLTLASHMLDCELFGLNPRGHHLTSLLLHAGTTLLLFEFLRRATGRPLPAAAVAALFAVHPTHVESVVWIAERKDVLCGFFWMAALAAYLRYVRRPGVGRFLAVAALYAAALAAKPMAVTLPCVLLLLDIWPLGRLRLAADGGTTALAGIVAQPAAQRAGLPGVLDSPAGQATPWRRLVFEKLPLFALAAGSAAATIATQRVALAADAASSWALRLATAATSYAAYLGKTLYPVRLAVLYPFLRSVPPGRLALALAILAAVTGFCLAMARRAPYLAVGWLWYLGTLVPVIGILQVGAQRMADRYLYLPSIGLYIAIVWAIVWGLDKLARERPRARAALGACAVAVVAVLAVLTMRQTRVWRSSITLFRHSLSIEESYLAHADLADALNVAGDRAGAYVEYRAALRMQPMNPRAWAGLGISLQSWGRPREAVACLERSLALDPNAEVPRLVLAMALSNLGEDGRASAELSTLVARDPRSVHGHLGLAALLARRGRVEESRRELALARALAAAPR